MATNQTLPADNDHDDSYAEDRPKHTRSNSINLASVFRGDYSENQDEETFFRPQTIRSERKEAHRRSNSINVASLYRNENEHRVEPTTRATSPAPHSCIVDHDTIQQHIHIHRTASHLDDEEMGLTSDDDATAQVHFSVPLRQRAVTFGAYYDNHNNEMIPELVQVETHENQDQQQQPAYDSCMQRLLFNLTKARPATQIACTLIACLLTFSVINRQPNLDAQIATMVLVTLCGATFPHVITAVACGVYAGSVNSETIGGRYAWVVLLGIITALTWQLISSFHIMLGFSGRLGATAFVAMNITALMVFTLDPSLSFEKYGSVQTLWDDMLSLEEALVTLVATVFLASSAGYFRLIATVPVNPVLVPSAWALFCMLVTSVTEYQCASNMLDGYAVGAYVAMASEARVPSTTRFAIVGVIAGLWSIFLQPFFLGFGGKSGFTAMLGYATYLLLKTMYKKRFNYRLPASGSKDKIEFS